MNEYSKPISTTDGEHTQFTQIQYVFEEEPPKEHRKPISMVQFLL